jgi:hypothetical protein
VLVFRPSRAFGAPQGRRWFDDPEVCAGFGANLHRVAEPSFRHYVRARELKAAYRSSVDYHKNRLKVSTDEALPRADERCSLGDIVRVLDCPPEEVRWTDLKDLAEHSPQRALHRWEEVQQAALEELQGGHQAAAVMEGYFSDAWQRAQFLAIRAELSEGWQPRNGVERQLIDQLAQAQVAMFFWQERLCQRASVAARREHRDVEERGGWDPPRVDEHQAIAQAAAMTDRFHRMFQRTLRSLCSLRKVPLAVLVQNAGQVNVGGQQINVAAAENRPR